MVSFRKAYDSEINVCTDILKSAFCDYPFFEVYVDDLVKRKKFFNSMMEVWMKTSFRNENVLVAELEGKIAAVAVMKAPEDKLTNLWDYVLAGGIKVVLAGGLRNTVNFIKMAASSDEVCRKLPEPKWYLSLLAVSNIYKGQGIGSRMLKECIIPFVSNNGGRLLTFNTDAEINRNFYIKNGFDEFYKMTLQVNGKKLDNWSYRMILAQ